MYDLQHPNQLTTDGGSPSPAETTTSLATHTNTEITVNHFNLQLRQETPNKF